MKSILASSASARALWELAPHALRRLPGFIGPSPSTSLDELHMKFLIGHTIPYPRPLVKDNFGAASPRPGDGVTGSAG